MKEVNFVAKLREKTLRIVTQSCLYTFSFLQIIIFKKILAEDLTKSFQRVGKKATVYAIGFQRTGILAKFR